MWGWLKQSMESMRRRVVVLISIGTLFLALVAYVSSRSTSNSQRVTTQPILKQQKRVFAQAQLPSPKVNAWAILLQVMQRLDDPVGADSLKATFRDLQLVDFAISTLATECARQRSPIADRIEDALKVLSAQIAGFRREQDDSDDAPPEEVTIGDIRITCEQLEKLYEPAVLDQARALAQRYQCPMHPDVIGMKGETCPKCGMTLDTQIRLSASTWRLVLPFLRLSRQTWRQTRRYKSAYKPYVI